jgi:large subunit ribosomal protein L7A
MKAVECDGVTKIFIAKDAEERVISPIKDIAIKKGLTIEYVDTMTQLGKASGINVGAAVVCVLKNSTAF